MQRTAFGLEACAWSDFIFGGHQVEIAQQVEEDDRLPGQMVHGVTQKLEDLLLLAVVVIDVGHDADHAAQGQRAYDAGDEQKDDDGVGQDERPAPLGVRGRVGELHRNPQNLEGLEKGPHLVLYMSLAVEAGAHAHGNQNAMRDDEEGQQRQVECLVEYQEIGHKNDTVARVQHQVHNEGLADGEGEIGTPDEIIKSEKEAKQAKNEAKQKQKGDGGLGGKQNQQTEAEKDEADVFDDLLVVEVVDDGVLADCDQLGSSLEVDFVAVD